MVKVYYDKDTDIGEIKGRKIGIIGYGVQGRAQALNLRDSGCDVIVGNIRDDYYKRAESDDFSVYSIEDVVKAASICFVLIPDQAHKTVYEVLISPNLKKGDTLVFAHGYSINYKEIVPSNDVDVCLLAPRMPGKPIREYYLNGGGVPAYIDVYNNASGRAKEVVLALAKALGFTKAGVMQISFKEETELDLFVEQFFLPLMIRTIRLSFDVLVEEGYTPEALLMELYASGEIGELLLMASDIGIYEVWKNHASPTCQYGIFRNSKRVLPEKKAKGLIKEVLKEIKDGTFMNDLCKEAEGGYRSLHAYNEANQGSNLMRTEQRISKIIKCRQHRRDDSSG